MSVSIRTRITLFVVTLSFLIVLIAWAAYASWTGVQRLRLRFTDVQIESFRIADRLQASVLQLNETYLKYLLHGKPAEWQQFTHQGDDLRAWLAHSRHNLSTPRERQLLTSVEQVYAEYWKRASDAVAPANTLPPLERFAQVQDTSERLLAYGDDLAEAHRDALSEFLADSQRSLSNLQAAIFGALLVLTALGVWVGLVVFRELIGPLRVQLGESQATIERQEKLASLGVLAAGVAHEIRNPLTAVKARLFTQKKGLAPGSRERRDADFIGHEIDRLEKIVRDFLQFARPSDPTLAPVPPHDLLQGVHDLLAEDLAARGVELVLGEITPQPVQADAAQIRQVLINLVQNAAESIESGPGRVTLSAREDSANATITFEISDNGAGIPPEVSKRLFDPFFTTKQAGTGLGLAISARIAEKHGGSLRYTSQVTRGSTFGIVLPAAPVAPLS